jgi:hypothetical protein
MDEGTGKRAIAARLDAEFGRHAIGRAAVAVIARLAAFTALVVIGSRYFAG